MTPCAEGPKTLFVILNSNEEDCKVLKEAKEEEAAESVDSLPAPGKGW